MTAFAAATPGSLTAEPDKRVNYTLGLVLGVDEFQQEQLFHMAARRGHDRLLHGYGTVSGLAITTPDPGDPNPEIHVGAGVAVDPCGREICVPETMCVGLTGWLDRHRDTLEELYPGGTAELPLAVVLCYRECATDVVPIPGEPCRTQEDAMQASRIQDSFELRLALREDSLPGSPPGENTTGLHTFRPDHAEEAAVRAFGDLLGAVDLATVAPPGSGVDELLAAVRALADTEAASLSPPAGGIVLPANEARTALREAFRVWVTEVRPAVRAREPASAACGASAGDCCVLLGEVDLPVTPEWAVAGASFEAREENRPVLLHTRLLQEWWGLAGGGSGNDDTFATVEQVAADTVRVWLHYPAPLALGADDVTVSIDGGPDEAPAGVGVAAGAADNVFDVQLVTAPDDGATVELRFDLATLSLSGAPGGSLEDALHSSEGGLLDRYGPEVRAYTVFRVLTLPDYAGDLQGTHPDATVVGLQQNPVSSNAPDNGDVLTWDGGAWIPAPPEVPDAPALPPATGDVAGTYPALEVSGLRGRPVADVAPALNQYLRWTGSRWVPAHVGGFVIAERGRYAVVGAGMFGQDADVISPVAPVYNGLTVGVRVLATFVEYSLQFDGYVPPAGEHMYIVHAHLHPARAQPSLLLFHAFADDGIRMRLLGSDLKPTGRLIIEIHRIG